MTQEPMALVDATVLTCDARDTRAEAVAIARGRIVAVGSREKAIATAGVGAHVVNLDGATVLPGLIDTHPHLMHFGVIAEPLVDLSDAVDHADIVGRIAAKAADTAPGDWVMTTPVGEAHYFIRRSWRDLTEQELPTRGVLDRASTHHPVFIQAWAPTTPNVIALNSLALQRLGITAASPDQVGRVTIEKAADGVPTGRLFGAVTNYYSNEPFTEQLMRNVPVLDPAAIGPGTERAMRAYNALGVTGVYEGHTMDFPLIAAYQWLRDQGRLTLRVLCCPEAQPYGLATDVVPSDEAFRARLEQAASLVQRSDDLLRVEGITIGRGGPCGPGMILMRDPYLDPFGQPTTGVSFVDVERAEEAMRFAQARGVRLNIVTAGTAETDNHLDTLERLATHGRLATDSGHWLLQHLYFVEPAQARRIAALGLDVTTSMSFSWGKGELVRERFGEHLLEHLIPLRRLLDAGLHIGCGSDWGPKNIFEHIALASEPTYAASGRPAATPGISRSESLAMWTREAAHVLGWDSIGSIQTGYHADICIVDRHPLSCPIEDLATTKVIATLLGGELVHGAL